MLTKSIIKVIIILHWTMFRLGNCYSKEVIIIVILGKKLKGIVLGIHKRELYTQKPVYVIVFGKKFLIHIIIS